MNGVTVDLIDTRDRSRFGHPRWTLPLQGGIVRDGGVTVEVRPTIEQADAFDWRPYNQLVGLAERAEQNGGFARSGDEIHVGEDILVGRDALEFLTVMWHRAAERAGDQDAAYRQGYEQGKRETRDAVKAAVG